MRRRRQLLVQRLHKFGSLLGLPSGVGSETVFPRPRLPLATVFRPTAVRSLPSSGVTMFFPRTRDPFLPCYT